MAPVREPGAHMLRPPEDDTTAAHRHPWWAGVDNLRAVVERGTADYASVSDLTLKVGIMAA